MTENVPFCGDLKAKLKLLVLVMSSVENLLPSVGKWRFPACLADVSHPRRRSVAKALKTLSGLTRNQNSCLLRLCLYFLMISCAWCGACIMLLAMLATPSRPEVSSVSETSVLVQWTMPSSSLAHVASFRLQCKQLSEDRSSSVWKTVDEDIPAGWRSYEVVKLRPGIYLIARLLLCC